MPIIHKEGKDIIIFAPEEELAKPSEISLPEAEPNPGLILPSGEINWNCPCLGGMATGPCGVEFREAFSCFHYSTSEPKGSDCYDAFKIMQNCMSEYPSLYANKENLNGDDETTSEIINGSSVEDNSMENSNLKNVHSKIEMRTKRESED